MVSRAIHTNLLGASKEVKMLLQNTVDGGGVHCNGILSSLLYREGEYPLLSYLPAAPDDEFLDSRSTQHKRLPHICRDLQYIVEMPGTGLRLLSQPVRSTCNAAAVGVVKFQYLYAGPFKSVPNSAAAACQWPVNITMIENKIQ